MRIAVIDLGTNTFDLIIDEIIGKSHKKLFESKQPVKLGEGGIDKNIIVEDAIERALISLTKFKKIIDKWKSTKTIAFATSAFRSASNGLMLVEKIKNELDINVEIINGDKEAELIYFGVKQALNIGNMPNLIIDVGGGSIEFIIANNTKIFWKQSFTIGAARLLAKFNPTDPIKSEEISIICNYLQEELQPLWKIASKYSISGLIGSSGSFDSLAEMILNKYHTVDILKNKTTYDFDLQEYVKVHNMLLKCDKKQRMKIKGLVAMRVDMIVVASICIHFVIHKLNITQMRLSTYSLKEGAVLDYINRHLSKINKHK